MSVVHKILIGVWQWMHWGGEVRNVEGRTWLIGRAVRARDPVLVVRRWMLREVGWFGTELRVRWGVYNVCCERGDKVIGSDLRVCCFLTCGLPCGPDRIIGYGMMAPGRWVYLQNKECSRKTKETEDTVRGCGTWITCRVSGCGFHKSAISTSYSS